MTNGYFEIKSLVAEFDSTLGKLTDLLDEMESVSAALPSSMADAVFLFRRAVEKSAGEMDDAANGLIKDISNI